jgi:hypothetical protein
MSPQQANGKEYVKQVYSDQAIRLVNQAYVSLMRTHEEAKGLKHVGLSQGETLIEAVRQGKVSGKFMSMQHFNALCAAVNADAHHEGIIALRTILKSHFKQHQLKPSLTVDDNDNAVVMLDYRP